MGIQARKDSVGAAMERYMHNMERVVIRNLAYIGEAAVTKARDVTKPNTYKDRTGNLRSSIGYVVAHNGVVSMSSSFDVVKGGAEGATGGRALAEKLSKKYSDQTYCLILVAGMKYAAYVENGHTAKNGRFIKGRDVLASAELIAEQLVKELFKK